MLFNSIDFLIFFPIVLLVYFIIPKKVRYIWLLISSYYFYMNWNPKYAILIAVSTIVTYLCGILLPKAANHKKLVVATSFIINLAILGFFKYFDFFIDNINTILTSIGHVEITNRFDIMLPVGISFYTFQALGYTIDVYRGEIEPERNPLRYALFVSFFPQLVAGPIERSKNLLKQLRDIENIAVWNLERISNGFILIIWGLFMKMVLADRMALFVDTIYDEYWLYGSVELILATILFTLQIYCDFASYSIIAIGAAKVMGFELMENFRAPFFAISIRDHWRRWHISLSTWFKDYLYIPLGGSRCSKARHYLNIMITFLVSGLWHGASWHYVIWGGLHGLYQVLEMIFDPVFEKIWTFLHVERKAFSFRLGQIIRTFSFIVVGFVIFRADNMKAAIDIFKLIFMRWNPWTLFDGSLYTHGLAYNEIHILLVGIVLLLLVDVIRERKGVCIDTWLRSQNLLFRWIVVWSMVLMIVTYGIYGPGFDASAFIYFQF